MADPALTASSSGRTASARPDETSRTATHRFPRALNIWSSWWRRPTHKEAESAENGTPAAEGGFGAPDVRQSHFMAAGRDRDSSTASRASVSTQPVLVRTYSASKSRTGSRATSRARTLRDGTVAPSMATMTDADAKLPSIEDFKFNNLLLAASSDVSTAIDAIAEICARSRLSLADEYGAHLPPFSHTLPPMPRTRGQMQSQREVMKMGAESRRLTTVPETSSNSEHSSPSTSSGSGKSRGSAYGSLTKVLRRSGSARGVQPEEPVDQKNGEIAKSLALLWHGKGSSQAFVVKVASPKVSMDPIVDTPTMVGTSLPDSSSTSNRTQRVASHQRSRSWFGNGTSTTAKDAQSRLKEMLESPAPG